MIRRSMSRFGKAVMVLFLMPVMSLLPATGQGLSDCAIEIKFAEAKHKIEELQKRDYRRDRSHFEVLKSKISELADIKEWTEERRQRVINNIFLRTTQTMLARRAAVLSERSRVFNLARQKNPKACQKLQTLYQQFQEIDRQNDLAWKKMVAFLGRQISRARLHGK